MSDPVARMDRFFHECEALSEMTCPTGFVASQDYARLLKVAKQYRKWVHELLDGEIVDGYIRIPRLKKVKDLKASEPG